ncbi:helix-turn-helix transcriptional regulator [Streptomyces olivochromogenes]|uniref:helix-turn-helix transcriptional regulator n=1 Tax=Streptomyces olivochromogenes TaxID=1963 RepID=UPI001F3926B1|nr:helix-turn-helix domain-containing protein [Streptomyces olivochromogenes]MCF3131106.1 helix-turn-helix domain-containing protein [Streptomyces olivochromogenes]
MVDSSAGRPSRGLTNDTRQAVLDLLRRSGKPVTVQEISAELGLHTNTVRFHLNRLMQDNHIWEEQASAVGPGRPSMVYTAAQPVRDEAGDGYRFLAEILASQLASTAPEPETASIAAGQEWGRFLTERRAPFARAGRDEAIGQMESMLAGMGFDPEVDEEGSRILLRNCPFRKVADELPGVVCSIHLGLMRGALAEIGAPVEVTELQRFNAPRPCVASLSGPEERAERDAPA